MSYSDPLAGATTGVFSMTLDKEERRVSAGVSEEEPIQVSTDSMEAAVSPMALSTSTAAACQSANDAAPVESAHGAADAAPNVLFAHGQPESDSAAPRERRALDNLPPLATGAAAAGSIPAAATPLLRTEPLSVSVPPGYTDRHSHPLSASSPLSCSSNTPVTSPESAEQENSMNGRHAPSDVFRSDSSIAPTLVPPSLPDAAGAAEPHSTGLPPSNPAALRNRSTPLGDHVTSGAARTHVSPTTSGTASASSSSSSISRSTKGETRKPSPAERSMMHETSSLGMVQSSSVSTLFERGGTEPYVRFGLGSTDTLAADGAPTPSVSSVSITPQETPSPTGVSPLQRGRRLVVDASPASSPSSRSPADESTTPSDGSSNEQDSSEDECIARILSQEKGCADAVSETTERIAAFMLEESQVVAQQSGPGVAAAELSIASASPLTVSPHGNTAEASAYASAGSLPSRLSLSQYPPLAPEQSVMGSSVHHRQLSSSSDQSSGTSVLEFSNSIHRRQARANMLGGQRPPSRKSAGKSSQSGGSQPTTEPNSAKFSKGGPTDPSYDNDDTVSTATHATPTLRKHSGGGGRGSTADLTPETPLSQNSNVGSRPTDKFPDDARKLYLEFLKNSRASLLNRYYTTSSNSFNPSGAGERGLWSPVTRLEPGSTGVPKPLPLINYSRVICPEGEEVIAHCINPVVKTPKKGSKTDEILKGKKGKAPPYTTSSKAPVAEDMRRPSISAMTDLAAMTYGPFLWGSRQDQCSWIFEKLIAVNEEGSPAMIMRMQQTVFHLLTYGSQEMIAVLYERTAEMYNPAKLHNRGFNTDGSSIVALLYFYGGFLVSLVDFMYTCNSMIATEALAIPSSNSCTITDLQSPLSPRTPGSVRPRGETDVPSGNRSVSVDVASRQRHQHTHHQSEPFDGKLRGNILQPGTYTEWCQRLSPSQRHELILSLFALVRGASTVRFAEGIERGVLTPVEEFTIGSYVTLIRALFTFLTTNLESYFAVKNNAYFGTNTGDSDEDRRRLGQWSVAIVGYEELVKRLSIFFSWVNALHLRLRMQVPRLLPLPSSFFDALKSRLLSSKKGGAKKDSVSALLGNAAKQDAARSPRPIGSPRDDHHGHHEPSSGGQHHHAHHRVDPRLQLVQQQQQHKSGNASRRTPSADTSAGPLPHAQRSEFVNTDNAQSAPTTLAEVPNSASSSHHLSPPLLRTRRLQPPALRPPGSVRSQPSSPFITFVQDSTGEESPNNFGGRSPGKCDDGGYSSEGSNLFSVYSEHELSLVNANIHGHDGEGGGGAGGSTSMRPGSPGALPQASRSDSGYPDTRGRCPRGSATTLSADGHGSGTTFSQSMHPIDLSQEFYHGTDSMARMSLSSSDPGAGGSSDAGMGGSRTDVDRFVNVKRAQHFMVMADDADCPTAEDSERFRVFRNHVVGRGSFGTVYQCWDEDKGNFLVCKEMNIELKASDEDGMMKALFREYSVLTSLRHPNIVGVIGFAVHENVGQIFMEWMPSGSILSVLDLLKEGLREHVVSRFVRDALRGLDYLHSKGIIHRDVKPGNMLLGANGVLKLTDFGSSRSVLQSNPSAAAGGTLQTFTMVGTLAYLAPDSVHGYYSYAADIWSLGCSALHMATGRPPWGDSKVESVGLIFKIGSLSEEDHLPPIPNKEKLSPEFLDFVEKTLTFDRYKRPTAGELLQHPFILGVDHRDA